MKHFLIQYKRFMVFIIILAKNFLKNFKKENYKFLFKLRFKIYLTKLKNLLIMILIFYMTKFYFFLSEIVKRIKENNN